MWIAYAFASALFAGATAIFAKIGVRDVDSNLAIAIRAVVVVVFAWMLVSSTGSLANAGNIDFQSLAFLILSGLAGGASWMCHFRALQTGDVNKVIPIDKSSVVLTMILAFFLLGEDITPIKGAAMLLLAGGAWMMIERKKPDGGVRRRGWLFHAVLSAVFAALAAILGKIGIEGVEANLGVAVRAAVAMIMAWIVALARTTPAAIGGVGLRSWAFLVLSGVATGLSWLCYYQALRDGPASVVVPIDKSSILVTVMFGWLVLGEKLTAESAIGLVLMAGGTSLLLV